MRPERSDGGAAGGVPEARAWLLLPAAAAALYLVLTLHAARIETPTVDEFAHVPAGVAAWRQGRTDLYRSNPPLLKLLLAAPLALDSAVSAPVSVEPPLAWGPWEYGHRFMNANRESFLGLIFRARVMAIVLGLATGFVIFTWMRQVFGVRAASIVTCLFLLCPNILAHAHLATIDMGGVFSSTLALFTLRWAYQRPSVGRIVAASSNE